MKIQNKKLHQKIKWHGYNVKPVILMLRVPKKVEVLRAVYKLIEINDKFKFLRNGQTIVDWALHRVLGPAIYSDHFPKITRFCYGLLPIKPIPNVEFYEGTFTTDAALNG